MELLPCPFCGCDTITIYYDSPETVGFAGAGFYISHPLWKSYPDTWGCEAIPNWRYFDTEADAIAAWNRRAHPTAKENEG